MCRACDTLGDLLYGSLSCCCSLYGGLCPLPITENAFAV
jgi:hypothetical protein